MKDTFAIVAALMAIAGNVPYMRDVISGRVEPHAYSWFVWSIVSCTIFFGQLAKGAGIGALPTAASEIFTVIIFLLALRRGFRHVTRTDTYFLVAALAGLIPWALTRDPTVSVVCAVTIDFLAFVPTLRKTWRQPGTETPVLYSMNVVRHVLALFSLGAYNIATTLHSVAMICLNSLMTAFIVGRQPASVSGVEKRDV